MQETNRVVFLNANDENIESVRKALMEQEQKNGKGSNKIFTMLQQNAPCQVTITEASRRICAKSLTSIRQTTAIMSGADKK